jgi:hypothetical protein
VIGDSVIGYWLLGLLTDNRGAVRGQRTDVRDQKKIEANAQRLSEPEANIQRLIKRAEIRGQRSEISQEK